MLRQIELVLVLEQFASSFYYTTLQMVVKDRCANASNPDSESREDSQQKAMSYFYMTYTLISQLTSILPALLLARLGDRGWRRTPITVPLSGYLISRIFLLLVVLLNLPLDLMFAEAALFGLTGGFCSFWSGVMTLVSLDSTEADRSKMMMKMELLYGLSGLVGSLVSGPLFLLYGSTLGNGTFVLSLASLLNLLCLIFAISLKVTQASGEESEESERPVTGDVPADAPVGVNKSTVALLFAAAILCDAAMSGALTIMAIFVMKKPLSWNATQVGYGNAANCLIFLTSFLGVHVFRRCLSDVTLILIGMLSFASGIYFMAFVTATYLFYLARSLNMFAIIPIPTIRSLLSQQVPASSCGITLTCLQLSMKFSSLVYIPAFTMIYMRTLDWFPGFVFLLSGIITVLAMIPISIIGCFSARRHQYERIPGD